MCEEWGEDKGGFGGSVVKGCDKVMGRVGDVEGGECMKDFWGGVIE